MLDFEFLLGMSETLLCSVPAPHVKIAHFVDVHELLMFFCTDVDVFEAKNVLNNIL
jgi:hypothetical protein